MRPGREHRVWGGNSAVSSPLRMSERRRNWPFTLTDGSSQLRHVCDGTLALSFNSCTEVSIRYHGIVARPIIRQGAHHLK